MFDYVRINGFIYIYIYNMYTGDNIKIINLKGKK